MSGTPYRPPNWSIQSPARIVISFPGQPNSAQYSQDSGITASLPTAPTLFAFDAVIRAEHQQRVQKTQHPVQTGSSISDHAYIEPARLILDVGMSDVIDAFYNPSTWVGSNSKSVSAYQTMLALQFSRIPLTLTTKLRTYFNMIIESLEPTETVKTITGLRMLVEFGQIFLASTSQTQNSARSQDTNSTNLGSKNTQTPSDAQKQQNSAQPPTPSPAIGAGDWASDNWTTQSSWYSMFGGK